MDFALVDGRFNFRTLKTAMLMISRIDEMLNPHFGPQDTSVLSKRHPATLQAFSSIFQILTCFQQKTKLENPTNFDQDFRKKYKLHFPAYLGT